MIFDPSYGLFLGLFSLFNLAGISMGEEGIDGMLEHVFVGTVG